MKKVFLGVIVFGLILTFVGCQATDVVGKVAVTSFESIVSVDPSQVAFDEMNNGWALTSPGGERFVWGKDFSAVDMPDFMIELDATPFINAGLEGEKLDKDMYLFNPETNVLMIHAEVGTDTLGASDTTQPMDSFKAIVNAYRESIGYHEKLDHYGVKLGGGNMFEWAKDMKTNEIDIVFVLDPAALIDAGVDPLQVKDWVFAEVEVKDDAGKDVLVEKFLKPYNLQ